MAPVSTSTPAWTRPWQVAAAAVLLALGLGWWLEARDLASSSEAAPAATASPFFTERQVTVEGPAGVIAGTLTLPIGSGPFPALISSSGAGEQDRDGWNGEATEMAGFFADAGIATLRTDDRGVGASEGDSATATLGDLAADVESLIEFLRQHDDIDHQSVGLMGASQGSLVATLTANQHPQQVAFVILISAPGRPGRASILDQNARLERVSGTPEATIATISALLDEGLDWIEAPVSDEVRRQNLRPIARQLRRVKRDSPFAGSDSNFSLERELDVLTSPIFRSALVHDPAVELRRLRQPVLVVYGDLDLQVHPDFHLPAMEQALAANDRVTIERLPGLNHLLQPAETGLPKEYADGRRSPEVYELIARWLLTDVLQAPGSVQEPSAPTVGTP